MFSDFLRRCLLNLRGGRSRQALNLAETAALVDFD
jgi:hypothetical protein